MDILDRSDTIKIVGKKVKVTQNSKGDWTNYSNPKQINMIAKDGNFLWCATEGGVPKWNLSDNTYIHYTVLDGLADNNVSSVVIDSQKVIWVGTRGSGLSRFDTKGWISCFFKGIRGCKYIRTIAIDREDNIWICAEDGIFKFDKRRATLYPNKHK